MQQFTVPQFIDVEDKIIGPITARQFIIMLAGFLLIGICYKLFDFSLFITVTVFIFGFIIVFAFVKINGRPFHLFVLNLIQTLKRPNLRIWNCLEGKAKIDYEKDKEQITKQIVLPTAKQFAKSRLTELSLIVDTKGAYQGEEEETETETRIEKINN